MAFKKDEFRAMIEREGVADFIWARSWKDISGTQIGLYEMANDRWGCVFQIFPQVYSGSDAERKLASFFNAVELPDKSSVQFFTFASRNLTLFRMQFMECHKGFHHNESSQLEKDLLEELVTNREKWFKTHSNKNIFSKGNDLRLRNFLNLVCVTIPRKKREGVFFSESELVSYCSKVEQGLSDFRPRKFSSREWVVVMRELLIPDNPKWYPPEDSRMALNAQVVDADSILTLEDETNSIGIGHILSKEEAAMQRAKNSYSSMQFNNKKLIAMPNEEDEEENYRSKGFLSDLSYSISSLFSKKKKEENVKQEVTQWHAKVYTTKMYPSQMSLFSSIEKFYDFLGDKMSPTIPCPFFLSLCIYYENREKIKAEVSEKVKWNLWQTQSLGQAARFFPEILDRARESEVINTLLHNGESPIYASWCCCIMDDDILKANEYGELLKKEFLKDNWILQEESLIQHWMFLYHLPMNFEPYILKTLAKRMNTMFTANSASITPIVTGEKGLGQPVLSYIDRCGQVAGIDIFQSETNYNFIIIGTSGSGKSFTMADFITNYLENGAKIRIIDVGRSYKSLCQLVGGQYIEFTQSAQICLNFFTHILVKEDGTIHEDDMQTIIPLIALMAMQSVAPEDSNNDLEPATLVGYITEAVNMAYSKKQRNAGMQEVMEALMNISNAQKKENNGTSDRLLEMLIKALYPFGDPSGQYYQYFNGVNNLKFDSDFVVLELEELDSKPQLKMVVLASVSHMIQTEFFLSDKRQRKILGVDEAWSIMDNLVVVRFLETSARRLRKYNGALGVITQQIGDFFKNKATKAIFSNSAWKFFLQQAGESIQAAENSGELTLDKGLIALMRTVKAKRPYFSEVLIKHDLGSYLVGRLIVDKVAYNIYTTDPDDFKEIDRIIQTYGVSEVDARLIRGYSAVNGRSIEEEYKDRLEAGKLFVNVKKNPVKNKIYKIQQEIIKE